MKVDLKTFLSAMEQYLPLSQGTYDGHGKRIGIVIIDAINGFCTPGAGNLAPPVADPMIEEMVKEIGALAHMAASNFKPLFVFRDEHTHGTIEPPYPPHCWKGSGEELLVPKLSWLSKNHLATDQPKDCINGFVGAMREDGGNNFVDWVNKYNLTAIVAVGICTDICNADFVVSVLSARNIDLMPTLTDVVVYTPATSTYNLPQEVVDAVDELPNTARHDQGVAHHTGLWMMQSRGAILANKIENF